MAKYNGYRSWNAWNVSLWINNDESLYDEAVALVKKYGRSLAAKKLPRSLPSKTPDGAKYNYSCIYGALEGIE